MSLTARVVLSNRCSATSVCHFCMAVQAQHRQLSGALINVNSLLGDMAQASSVGETGSSALQGKQHRLCGGVMWLWLGSYAT
jgi:hypothetical protein